jgi:hypothetical protein
MRGADALCPVPLLENMKKLIEEIGMRAEDDMA